MEHIIRETVKFGSVFLALEHKLFTCTQLLYWLVTAPFDHTTLIAYKAACSEIHPNKQYLSDSWHFLSKNPKYGAAAILLGLDSNIFSKEDDNRECVKIYFQEDISINSSKHEWVYDLTSTIVPYKIHQHTIETILRGYFARNFIHNRDLPTKECNNLLVQADWTSKFRYTDDVVNNIIDRMKELSIVAPTYYEFVALPAYLVVAVKLYKEKLLSKLSVEGLLEFNKFFPNIIDKRLLNYDKLLFKIGLMSNEMASYILGFPIHIMIPNEEQIFNALELINENGTHGYINIIKDYNKLFPTKLPFTTGSQKFCNNEDVLIEDVTKYSPFDIVVFQTGDHIYRFTRPEFPQLLKSKKNHWTNEWLPESILGTIKGRQKCVDQLKLPPSRTMEEMFDRIKNETLFEVDKEEKESIENTNSSTDSFFANMNTRLFHQIFMAMRFDISSEDDDMPELDLIPPTNF